MDSSLRAPMPSLYNSSVPAALQTDFSSPTIELFLSTEKNVEKESKDSVVAKIRSSLKCITLHVEQMSSSMNSPRRGCRVRFTDKVSVSSPDTPINGFPSSIPNVLRVFLENGQDAIFQIRCNHDS
ncbi:hypothetical protein PFISCL1PPCAC_28996 [Pristionchus fissidentatus]|uniref:Uncharacterized protein n=1 Tax=Pristionchus fissidentatus TaxID=1538716 RepID=A0AAV5X2A9_9BILA|nr:hypothetical protein PFISCL1PPCAC_28996 [Pristionchus fissidentatus]